MNLDQVRRSPGPEMTWATSNSDVLDAVTERYSAASKQAEPGLCCPVDYDGNYLKVIPAEVLERDYGCGDPVTYLRAGDTVLDLGCGGGKVCFIAAQVVGPTGQVIGVDVNDDMLALARAAQPAVAEQVGYSNVTFVKARIEDLGLDLEFIDEHLARRPVAGVNDLLALEAHARQLRASAPVIENSSVDVVISNCVLNLVSSTEKRHMFAEITRVLRPGGRTVISDIVADRDVPPAMQADPDLWSGCYSGAMRQDRFLGAFVEAGLHGVTLLKQDAEPWQTIQGVEFRSVTVAAYKAPPPCRRGGTSPAVLYNGPFASVSTDSGLQIPRGVPMPVSGEDCSALALEPYRSHVRVLHGACSDDAGCGAGPPAEGPPTRPGTHSSQVQETGQPPLACQCEPDPGIGPPTEEFL